MTDRGEADMAGLAAYLDDLLDGSAWASTGAEAAEHIACVLGWRAPRTDGED